MEEGEEGLSGKSGNKFAALTASKNLTEVERLKKYDLALGDYNKAISLKPTDGGLYMGRGFVYRKLGNYDAALSDYNQAIQKSNFKNPLSYNGRGLVYKELKKSLKKHIKRQKKNPANN